MDKLVSILMPAYNAEKFIRQAIDSILNQSYTNFELLIADDASKDATKEIIESYTDKRIKTAHNVVNLGYLKTCNALIALALGDYITFQDADDWSDSLRIEKQIESFKQNSRIGLLGTFGYAVSANGEIRKLITKQHQDQEIRKVIPKYNQFLSASRMITREVYTSVGAYRLFFDRLGSEDYDWVLRISEKYVVGNVAEPLYFYRQHNTSVSKVTKLKNHLSGKIAVFLSDQRKQHQGKDALNSQELKIELDSYIQELEAPYLKNTSLIYLEKAGEFLFFEMYKDCLKACFLAIKNNPLSVNNYRTLFYCVRKIIFKS